MYPLLNQEMANHHRESLQREVVHEGPFAPTFEPGNGSNSSEDTGFSLPLFDRTSFLYGRPIIIRQKKSAMFGRRLILSLVLLCILLPLLGMTINISPSLLITGSLLCLLVIVLSVVLGRI
jgi:hypothetical protein